MRKPATYNDEEARKHEDHCYVWVISPDQRTKYSCNCSRKQVYQANNPLTMKHEPTTPTLLEAGNAMYDEMVSYFAPDSGAFNLKRALELTTAWDAAVAASKSVAPVAPIGY